MERNPTLADAMRQVHCVAAKRAAAGDNLIGIGNEMAFGLARFLDGHFDSGQMAAYFRSFADTAAALGKRAPQGLKANELLELSDRARDYLRNLQLAGVPEAEAVTALHNACVLEVMRTRGAKGAADWLRRIADATEANADLVEAVARAS